MGLPWKVQQRERVEEAMIRFPVDSGKCAALARAVIAVARVNDAEASGVQVNARKPARYILPKHPKVNFWHSHTLVRTLSHHVDALTGADGCVEASYLETHWNYPECLVMTDVDVDEIDPGVQDVDP